MAATITKGGTLPDSSNKSDFYALIDSATITGIVNAEIAAAAAIEDTKLAQLTTASKVDGAALTGLASVPAGAGVIPVANVPTAIKKITDTDADTSVDIEESADADTIVGKVIAVEALRIHNSGIVDLPKQSRIRVLRSTIQTIATITWTKVQLDSEDYDNQNEFDSVTNFRFTATKAGVYALKAIITYHPPTADKGYSIGFYKNGVVIEDITVGHASYDTRIAPCSAMDVLLAVNDYIELYTYHDAGVDRDIISAVMTIHKLS